MKRVHESLVVLPFLLKELDKPNVHRILDLLSHAIPKYDHAYNISVVGFGRKNQSVKKTYRRGNNVGNHLWIVRMNLTDAWIADYEMAKWYSNINDLSSTAQTSSNATAVRLNGQLLTICLFRFAPAL